MLIAAGLEFGLDGAERVQYTGDVAPRVQIMGSSNDPRILDYAAFLALRAAFYDIYGAIHAQDVFKPVAEDDEELQIEIIRRLLPLLSGGTLPEDYKSRVLRSLPLR
jgi:hypothetical protein